MRILCVIDSLGSGGAQRQLVELAMGFKNKGHEVSFLTYHYIPFYDHFLDNSRIVITCISESNYLKRFIKIRSFIRRGKYDALLSFLGAPNFICEVSGLPFRKWKLVVGERSANPNILRSFKLITFIWFHFLADYVVANSYTNLKIVRSINPFLSDSKCRVISNAVDFNRWRPSSDYVPRMEGRLRLVIAASHQYLKNLNGLLTALSLLSIGERDKIIVEWYGDRLTEPFYDNSVVEAQSKIRTFGFEDLVLLRPATHDITRIIQEADAIGLFSFYEGFPNAVCEGMACAKPVVCSKVSDLPNYLTYDSKLLCDPNEPQSIKQALSYLISLSNDRLIEIGSINEKIARDRFDREIIISNYLQLLNNRRT